MVAVTSPTFHPTRWSCRIGSNLGRSLAACGGGKSLRVRLQALCMGFGVHIALISPSVCSVEDGF